MLRYLLIAGLLLLGACATSGPTTSGGTQPEKEPESFRLSNLAKSDISYLADLSMQQLESMLKELTIKLYKRNPRELKKGRVHDLDDRLDSIFAHRLQLIFDELDGKEEIRAMLLGLEPEYEGDRVFAIMVGLTGMLRRSYGYREEFFMFSSLDGQALYNSARNIEVLAWRLRTRLNKQGEPLLLTNSRPGEPENLSFERHFGKMIGVQDLIAELAASKNNRTISKVVQSFGSMVFIPIP